jgi:hypothetical protein
MGFLIDEDEFEITPAISRVFQIYETDTKTKKKRQRKEDPNHSSVKQYNFTTGQTEVSEIINYNVNLKFVNNENVQSYDVYINDNFYGTDNSEIQINSNDVLKIDIIKEIIGDTSFIIFNQELL